MSDRSGDGRTDGRRSKRERRDEVALTSEQIRRDLNALKEHLLRIRERLDTPIERRR
jgi:hypothetical protein